MDSQNSVLNLDRVSVVRDGEVILGPVSWSVAKGQRWVVLGPNGGGKSTLLAVAGLTLHPSKGEVEVFGMRLGSVDVRPLKSRIGICSNSMALMLDGRLTAHEIVYCGLYGALEPWWDSYSPEDHDRAGELLNDVGLNNRASHPFGSLSSGERQRCLLARTLMAKPDLLILDEPSVGLDLAGRFELMEALDQLADTGLTSLLVTHQIEDIPESSTHLATVADAQISDSGPIRQVMTSEVISSLFGVMVEISRNNGGWIARPALN